MIDSINKQSCKSKKSVPVVERLEKFVETPAIARLLAPAAFVYGVGGYLRSLFYNIGLAAGTRASVPVVSIGNVTVGGTGKTPVVIDLADRLSAQGLHVAILSRGYRRLSKAKTVLVSNGCGPVVSVEDSGDEPFIIARAVPAATVIVGSKRVTTAKLAIEQYGAQIILLDDGFQHMQLKRDIDIVLFDFNDDPDGLALLPGGRLREPLSALSRASVIVITKIPYISQDYINQDYIRREPGFDQNVKRRLQHLHGRLASIAPAAVLCFASFVPNYLLVQTIDGSSVVSLTELSGKKIFALCALASPESFFASLTTLQATIVDQMSFSDHHWFDAGDIDQITSRFRASKAAYIITSEKDLVRLHLPADLTALTFALMLEPVWLDSEGVRVATPDFVQSVLALAQVEVQTDKKDIENKKGARGGT